MESETTGDITRYTNYTNNNLWNRNLKSNDDSDYNSPGELLQQ